MAENVYWWGFLLSCVFAFFFSYGIVEELIRKWSRGRQTRKPKLVTRTIDKSPDTRGNGHSDPILH